MKKLLIITIAAMVLLLAACSTAVSISYLSPAEINMGSYRNIAIASAVPYSGMITPSYWMRGVGVHVPSYTFASTSSDSTLARSAADRATSLLVNTLSSSGYFNVTPPAVTDSLITAGNYGSDIRQLLADRNIDAVIIPKVTGMTFDEYVTAVEDPIYARDANGRQYIVAMDYDFYINQTATLNFSYTIIDAKTLQIIAVREFSDRKTNYSYIPEFGFIAPSASYYFDSILQGFQSKILSQLVPQRRSASVDLMDNKPKVAAVENAYKLAADGYTEEAYQAFLAEYKASGHLPSGYNAAILRAANGYTDDAIALLQDIQTKYSSDAVRGLLSDLQRIKQKEAEAREQLNSSSSSAYNTTTSGMNIFQAVMGV